MQHDQRKLYLQVLPEVAAREAEEKKRAEDERAKLKELLAKGKLPKALEELIQDDQEETPDEIIEASGRLWSGLQCEGVLHAMCFVSSVQHATVSLATPITRFTT